MKVVAISDTHGRREWRDQVPACDVLIHAGDITSGGTLSEMKKVADWLNGRDDIKNALFVPGNHDRCFEESLDEVRRMLPRSAVLIDQGVSIDGKVFWGSPWTDPFMDWWFMLPEEKQRELYQSMPPRIDVLITHGPPYGVLDPGWKEDHVGSVALRDALSARSVDRHIFGHLHAAGGKMLRDGPRRYHNVAFCDEAYRPANAPLVFDL
jgi:Icc-related predicted phosphoesterase